MKEHKKMYKRGKLWVAATLFVLALGIQIGGTTDASADTVTPAQQVTMQQTNVAAQTAPQTENSSYNKADQGNYAALDSVQLNQQGQLEVSGWHATNAAVNRPNHWLIAYDETTRQELNRIQVQTPVARPDVARVHNVYDAAKSGFHEQLNLTPAAITNGDSITVVSRYTADPAGNGDAVDYWFAPFKIDTRNEAYLEGTKLTDNQLVVGGWHATNLAADKPQHYLIVLDTSDHNRELGRINVTNSARPDVARVFPGIINAAHSGFTGKFTLPDWVISRGDTLNVISRYTSSADGNSDYVDYWFAPVQLGLQNVANLDNVHVQNNQLVVSGWHATNQATTHPYHYLILLDQTANGRELGRVKVQDPLARPDVARIYPLVNNAGQSGFQGAFDLGKVNFNHRLQVISRYSGSAAGNSDYVDYWFPTFGGPTENRANLDGVDWSNGQQLKVTGWHANNLSQLESHHYLILFDNTANRQVAVAAGQGAARPDVARAFPEITTAGRSGFTGTFDLTAVRLDPHHQYSVVSRYSTSAEGNGGAGQYTDYWLSVTMGQQRASYLDRIKMENDGLHLAGWMVDGNAADKPYVYAIVLSDGHEISRTRLHMVARPDIARLYPANFNSLNSGFNALVSFNPAQTGNNLQVILRFTDDPAGNGNADDQYSAVYPTNAGYLDQFSLSPTNLTISGWHVSDRAAGKKYQYLIALGQNGREIQRWRLTDLHARPDVIASNPAILENDQAGFAASITIPNGMYGQTVQLIHRYTDDEGGNGHYTDWYAAPVYIPAAVADPRGIQRFAGNTYYFDPTTRQPVTNRWVDGVYFGADGRMTNGQFSTRIINWFVAHEGKLTYSQHGARNGSDGTADCSGSMTAALQSAGATAPARVYATSNITPYLLQNGYRLIYQGANEFIPQYGDIVIWGHINNPWEIRHIVIASGSSDNQRAISVCWLTQGQPGTAVQEVGYDWYWRVHGQQYQYVFRLADPARN